MTRETKIGLLVGLAFIIVIGILLSDYNRVETQPAELRAVGENLRVGNAALHNGSSRDEVVPPPAPVTPVHPVATHDELRDPPRIVVTPGSGALPHATVADNSNSDRSRIILVDPPAASPPAGPTSDAPDITVTTNNNNNSNRVPPSLEQVAREHNETVIAVNNTGNHNNAALPAALPGSRQYKVEAGDTVSKLAGRYMGGNTKANREAIINANPTLKQNPNNLIVGRTYTIPAGKPATAAATAPVPAPTLPVAAAASTPAAGPQYWYTVKENDNLWRIASSQLGDGNAWAAIKELNKDLLKGRDDVRPNMRLRLPAKPVASIE